MVLISFLSFTHLGFAQTNEVTKEGGADSALVRTNITISEKIGSLATSLDEYLVGKKVTDKKNKTALIFDNQFLSQEGQDKLAEYDPRVSIELQLPNLEERWSLRFSNYDDEDQTTGVQRNRLQTTGVDSRYGASLRFFKKLGDVDIEFRPRLQVDKVSHTLGFSSSSQYKNMIFTPKFEVFGRSEVGTGQFLGLNLNFLVDDSNSLMLVNEQQYVDLNNLLSTNHGLVWYYKFDDMTRTSASFIYEFESKPTNFHMTRYVLSTGLEHLFLKQVLGMSFNPYIIFDHRPTYEKVAGVNLNIFIIF